MTKMKAKENNHLEKAPTTLQGNVKSTFMIIFALSAILLMLLPFLTTFNEFLTKIVEKFGFYMWIQNYIVPWLAQMVGAILMPFGVSFVAHPEGMTVNGIYLGLTWNCIGWQSLILLLVTFITGLTGSYTKISKLECILLGILGTFFVNLFRLTFTALLGAYWGRLFAIVFHDYFATLVTLIWLFFFWWFSYTYIFQSKRG